MTIGFTETAAKYVRHYLALRGKGLGVRLVVQPAECSGMAYHLEFVDQSDKADVVFSSYGEQIFVDPRSLLYVEGTVIDYQTEGDEEGFRIHNPNITHECGCGGSFQV